MLGDMVELKDYEGKCNVLFPQTTMQQISPLHRVRVEEVRIDPDPEKGDVCKVGSRKVGKSWEPVLSLSKTALMKIAQAAGIVWNWHETKVITASRDYVLYQAVGAMRKPSGEWIPLKSTKEIDLEVIREETYANQLDKAQKYENDPKKKRYLQGQTPEEYAEEKTRSNMIQWRKNKVMRAETGAMLRVIRALLSIKHQYSPQELKKPFAVPTVDFSPDYSDPEIRKMIAKEGVKATAELFGQSATHQLETSQQMGSAVDVSEYQQSSAGEPEVSSEDEVPSFDDPDTLEEDNFPLSDEELEELERVDAAPEDDSQQADPEDSEPACAECGTTEMSQKVIEYSQKHYGRPVCYKCQQEVGDQS